MSGFGLREGGFGGVQLDPFGTQGGGFGQYNIGNDGAQLDAYRRDAARIGWANGSITDDQYVSELRWYANQQEKGTSQYLSAHDDLDDAIYSIGRNERVRDVNNALTSGARVAALTRLISFDERRLGGMRGDNEQARELRDRIADSEAQIRDARYGDAIRAYNRTGDSAAVQAFIRRQLAASRGRLDHQTWQDRAVEWDGRRFEDDWAAAVKSYNAKPSLGAGAVMVDLLQGRMAQVPQGSAKHDELAGRLKDTRDTVDQDHWNARQADMQAKQAQLEISNEQYIAFLHERMNHERSRGNTTAYQQSRTNLLNETFRVNQDRMEQRHLDGTITNDDLISFYQGFSVTANLGGDKWREIQRRILDLRLAGIAAIPPGQDPRTIDGGHWVTPGRPGSSDVGFASQFDGSEFANQNCMFAAGAMMADALGLDGLSGADLRRYSGDEGGAGFQSMLATAYGQVGLGLDRFTGMSYRKFTNRLDKGGAGAVIAGLIANLPEQFRISGSGAHSVYVSPQRKQMGGETYRWVMDPLGRAGYTGQWWPDSVIQQFAWSGVRNPISGNAMYGNVMFGNRKGRQTADYRTPRPQSFDTDANGRSTLGRGGGTSRTEAGNPTDWRKGRVGRTTAEKGGAKDPGDTERFLAGIDRWAANAGGVESTMTPEDRRDRERIATDLLAKWKGNARLAAIEWFYGDADTDTSAWTQSQRAVANAVAGGMGYSIVPPGGIGIIIPGEPQARAADNTGNVYPQDPGPVTPGIESSRPHAKAPTVEDTDEGYAGMAREILVKAGVVVTPAVLRAMVAWIKTDTGGSGKSEAVQGNNPMSLRTTGNTDLPGQISRAEDGTAIFGSVQDGIDAAVRHLVQDYPDIIAAANSGQAGTFLDAVSRSDWQPGGYGNLLYHGYNEQTGTDTIVGDLTGAFDNATLMKLSGRDPELAELSTIDPTDPAQMGWLDKAIASAKRAYETGASTWEFETQSGFVVRETFNPEVYAELSLLKADYMDRVAAVTLNPADKAAAVRTAASTRDAAMRVTGMVAMDQYEDQVRSIDTLRQTYLATGDITNYANATIALYRTAQSIMGQDPGDFAGVTNNQNPTLDSDDLARLGRDIDQYQADPIIAMLEDGTIQGQKAPDGTFSAIVLPADTAFIMQDDRGRMAIHTSSTHPDDFFPPVQQTDAVTGEPIGDVPPYTVSYMTVTVNGYTFRVRPESAQVAAAKVDYYGLPTTVPRAEDPTSDVDVPLWGVTPGSGFGQAPIQRDAELPAARTTPVDGLVTSLEGNVAAMYIRYQDKGTGRWYQGYSLDGITWATREEDRLDSRPLRVVLNRDPNIVVTGTATEPVFTDRGTGKALDPSDRETAARIFHIEGTQPEDHPNPDGPPPNLGWKIQTGGPSAGGGVAIDGGQDLSIRGQWDRAISSDAAGLPGGRVLRTIMYDNARRFGAYQARLASGDTSDVRGLRGRLSEGGQVVDTTRPGYEWVAEQRPLLPLTNLPRPGAASTVSSSMQASRQATINANAKQAAAAALADEATRQRRAAMQARIRQLRTPTVTSRPGSAADRDTVDLFPSKPKPKATPTVIRQSGYVPRTSGIGVVSKSRAPLPGAGGRARPE